VQVDPVEHRAGDLALVVRCAARRAAAGERRIAKMAAAARVHRRDQLDVGRKADMRIGTGDIDLARLERLAQRIEYRALEFRYGGAIAPRYPTE